MKNPAPTPLIYEGTPAEQQQLGDMVETIRNAGPRGKAFIESLEKDPHKTRLRIAKSATDRVGNVFSLSSLGGGVTFDPATSLSGDNEVSVDPTNLIGYLAVDGSTVKETPEGLLLHELGHAERLNAGDPTSQTPGPADEAAVRGVTNPIRQEMGRQPEK